VSATPTAAAAAKSTAKPSVTLTVSQALAQGASFEGQFIRLQGMFAGWSGKCQGGAAPLTRSDWMLEDAANPEECLYVSGPKPADISTDISGQSLSPGVARAPVLVQGILRRSEKGLFYLRIETP
jgi:hypothetical protein